MGNSSSSEQVIAVNNERSRLKFHHTHSEHIRLLNNDFTANRVESFCKGICFSARPVPVGDPVTLRVTDMSNNWSGFLRVGFTANNPSQLKSENLPRYACPDMTNQPGNWAKALPEKYGKVNAVICYYVNRNGDVYLRINGVDDTVPFISGVNTSGPLWALIDIYGNASGVEFLDKLYSGPSVLTRTTSLPSNPTVSPSAPSRYYSGLERICFHQKVGKSISLNHEKTVATRNAEEYTNAYVFTERPIRLSETVVLQVLNMDMSYTGGLTVGMTSCDPANIRQDELPDDSDYLLDRPEYWVVHKDVLSNAESGDEFSLTLSEDGQVQLAKNKVHPSVIMHVDKTIPLWLFIDVYGKYCQLKLFGTMCNSTRGAEAIHEGHSSHRVPMAQRSQSQSTIKKPSLTVELPPVRHQSNDMLIDAPPIPPRLQKGTSNNMTLASTSPVQSTSKQVIVETNAESEDNAANECAVCFEKACDAVLYTCGHLCMCFECAQNVKKSNDPLCPICRTEIKDVIKIFRSY